jgi:ribosomal protein S18 acetylase RimI-like enzyme
VEKDQEYQGKGIGKSMWNELLNFFDPTKKIMVEVADYNKNAIRFYESLGFVDTGERFVDENIMSRRDFIIPEMRMIRQ